MPVRTVERALAMLLQVGFVNAVAGVPDDEWGETVAAAIVPEAGAEVSIEEIQAWVRDRVRSSRSPSLVRFTDLLPYSETDKLLRRELKG